MTRIRQAWRPSGGLIGFLALSLALLGGCREDPTAVTPPCGEAPPLADGATVMATLTPGDARRGGAYVHYYTVWPQQPTRYRIEMSSAAVDPFLYLFDVNGDVLAQSFHRVPGTGLRSVVVERTLEAGCHTVGASAWDSGATGPYVLRADAVTGEGG